jgi:regulator of protease activity HflC (stomatin/prohibitin superfamily)
MADEEKGKKKEKDLLEADVGTGPGCLRTTVWSVIVGLLAIIVLVVTLFVEKVEPWEVGLRYWLISIPPEFQIGDYGNGEAEAAAEKEDGWRLINAGDASDPLRPGYNVIVPFIHSFVKYDCSIKRYEFAPLQVRTVENQDEIDVYVTILYRVNRQMVKKLREFYATDQMVKEGVGKVGRAELEKKLGAIRDTTGFYGDSEKLRLQVEKAKNEMNAKLYIQGIEIVDVLVWDFIFKEDIEASIISKVLSEERTRVETELKDAYGTRAELQRLLAEAEARLVVGIADGEAEARKLDAEAFKVLVERAAEGDRKILEAQAEGKGMMNRALSGRGGQTYVGLEYARALEGVELIILPAAGRDGVNPLDLERTIKQLQPSGSGRGSGQ